MANGEPGACKAGQDRHLETEADQCLANDVMNIQVIIEVGPRSGKAMALPTLPAPAPLFDTTNSNWTCVDAAF